MCCVYCIVHTIIIYEEGILSCKTHKRQSNAILSFLIIIRDPKLLYFASKKIIWITMYQ